MSGCHLRWSPDCVRRSKRSPPHLSERVKVMAQPTQEARGISRPPTARELALDASFRWATRVFAGLTTLVVALIVLLIAKQAMPAILKYGPHFIVSTRWDAGKGQFGILPEIFGTLLSSTIGVALAAVFGIAVAVFLTEEFIPRWLQSVLKNVITLLAAIPSVVYGLWGIFF